MCGLCKSFGDNEVLCGIDLMLYCGEVVVLIGFSGLGKMMVLCVFNGFEILDIGMIVVVGGLEIDFVFEVKFFLWL